MGGKPGGKERDLSGDQRKLYEDDIKVCFSDHYGAVTTVTSLFVFYAVHRKGSDAVDGWSGALRDACESKPQAQ
jgi:hypothetical protein